MPKHKPHEYVNIRAWQELNGGQKFRWEQLQKQASQDGAPVDVVYYDVQYNKWRDMTFCSPITREQIEDWKRDYKLEN